MQITKEQAKSLIARGVESRYHEKSLYELPQTPQILKWIKFLESEQYKVLKQTSGVLNIVNDDINSYEALKIALKAMYLMGGLNFEIVQLPILLLYYRDAELFESINNKQCLVVEDFYDEDLGIEQYTASQRFEMQGLLTHWLSASGSLITFSSKPLAQVRGYSKMLLGKLKAVEVSL